ncbi:MAG: hypothetical protein ABW220_15185, partial [Burkholderiaceae bacterium]
NVWLSKTRNLEAKRWEYWLNIFDANSTGVYDTEFQAPPTGNLPPLLQFIPDRNVDEEKQVSFLVEASSPSGKPVTITAAPLPAGATLVMQPADAQAPTLARAVFDWKPAKGTAGSYLITYTATDGTLSATRSATIKVNSSTPPPGPGTPTVNAPAAGAQVTTLKPTLSVLASTQSKDPTTKLQFELYRDEAMTQLVDSGMVNKAGNNGDMVLPTSWQPAADLLDNTRYWWRARAFDGGQTYSPWISARFFVNLFNDPPDQFNLASPAPAAEVTDHPVLSWSNSNDRDGDVVTYVVSMFRDAALKDVLVTSPVLAGAEGGTTSWTPNVQLVNHATYYWRVTARDALGAETASPARPFTVNVGNTPPSAPVLVSPANGAVVPALSTLLSIESGTDAEGDLITYVFELDTVPSFDSGQKRSSGTVMRSAGAVTSWAVSGLVENQRYHWRVKAQDGRAETDWLVARFQASVTNEAPATPTIMNPGNGAWSGTRQPVLEANPVVDPEGDTVRYEFEVYRDAAMRSLAWSGTSDTTSVTVAVPLDDFKTHWWRLRALDPQNTASGWSAPAVLYVSTGTYQDPSIQVTSPATTVTPTIVQTPLGERKQVTLTWQGVDPNIDPTVSLYYSSTRGDYAGTVIVDGLRQAAGTHTGSFVWDVTGLPPGAYYVYGVIQDAKGVGRGYAPGSVVIANPAPSGEVLTSTTAVSTGVNQPARFGVRLKSAPTSDVKIGLNVSNAREGVVDPSLLTFTPSNWSTEQMVTVSGLNDCARDGKTTWQVVMGKAVSQDPNYAGVVGPQVTVTNTDAGDPNSSTSHPSIHVCKYRIESEKQTGVARWQYVVTAEWTNTGVPMSRVVATLRSKTAVMTVAEGQVVLGAIGSGETVKSTDTFTITSSYRLLAPADVIRQAGVWTVVVTPAP